MFFQTLAAVGLLSAFVNPTHAFQAPSYIAQWIPVAYASYGHWNASTNVAGQFIVLAADWFAAQGPWSVLDKTIPAPSGDVHDYLSWAPYYWADCSNVHNTTALTLQEIYTQCNYVQKDGQFSPDVRLVNDTGEFQAMSDAVMYNTLAYKITGNAQYAANAAHFIDVWFLDPDTYMNPNLDFAQIQRGANGSGNGTHMGVLDLHHITKVVSSVLILRSSGASAWTLQLDNGLKAWCERYIQWLTTASIALKEKATTNNHGSFYYAQTASLMVLVGDFQGARDLLAQYYGGIYLNQIAANGDQPLEGARTRPYHYRAYNAAAIIVISRIAEYIGWDTWTIPSSAGTNLKDAVDYTMNINPGSDDPAELYPVVAAIAAHYGDPDDEYAAWLKAMDGMYPGRPFFFWEQPLSNMGIVLHLEKGKLVLGGGTGTVRSIKKSVGAKGKVGVRSNKFRRRRP